MRILHIVDKYLNDSEIWLHDLLLNIPDCEIHIACNSIINGSSYQNKDWNYVVNKNGRLYYEEKNTSLKKNPLKKLRLTMQLFIARDFHANLVKYIKENKIDLIHAHFGNIGYESLSLSRLAKVPLVTSFYGYDYDAITTSNKKWSNRFRKLFTESDLILTEGEYGKRRLVEKGCSPTKIRIQRLGIRISQKRILHLTCNSDIKLIQIASFTEKKGQSITIRAFEKAAKMNKSIKLTLIGDNRDEKYANYIRELVSQSDAKDRITIKHFVKREKISEVLETHDFFIHPSSHAESGDSEGGAPTILFYAMEMGLPIISTFHCDIPELVLHEKSGFLVNERDIMVLSEYILKAAEMTKEERAKMSKSAYNNLVENYDIKVNGENLLKIYHSI